jgi:hypothetical protein
VELGIFARTRGRRGALDGNFGKVRRERDPAIEAVQDAVGEVHRVSRWDNLVRKDLRAVSRACFTSAS